MMFFHAISLAFVTQLVGAYLVAPDGTAAPGTIDTCSYWVQASYVLTCALIEEYFDITAEEFELWNPITVDSGANCSLILDLYYCVGINYGAVTTPSAYLPSTLSTMIILPSTSITPATTSSISSTATGSYITTPTPYQTGMASNCDSFHLVVSGDECGLIASAAGVSLADFYSWNPAVGTTCEYLDLGDYVCIDIIGVTPTTTSTGDGVATPTPVQTGLVANCETFHLVVSGDECGVIATNAGISLTDFYAWNPAVGSTCQYLDIGDYVCIGLISSSTR